MHTAITNNKFIYGLSIFTAILKHKRRFSRSGYKELTKDLDWPSVSPWRCAEISSRVKIIRPMYEYQSRSQGSLCFTCFRAVLSQPIYGANIKVVIKQAAVLRRYKSLQPYPSHVCQSPARRLPPVLRDFDIGETTGWNFDEQEQLTTSVEFEKKKKKKEEKKKKKLPRCSAAATALIYPFLIYRAIFPSKQIAAPRPRGTRYTAENFERNGDECRTFGVCPCVMFHYRRPPLYGQIIQIYARTGNRDRCVCVLIKAS